MLVSTVEIMQNADFLKNLQNRLDFFNKTGKIELALNEREC